MGIVLQPWWGDRTTKGASQSTPKGFARAVRAGALCLGLVSAAACGGGAPEGADARSLMAAGDDCTRCHGFSAAGTVFTDGGAALPEVAVVLGDATLTSNAAGNFFTTAPIAFPVTPEIHLGGVVRRMPQAAGSGACNGCHGVGSTPRLTGP